MKTQKHTPGTWKIAEKHCDNLTEKHIAWTNLREVLAPNNGDTSNDEDYANCKLIAAAPDMLIALQKAVEVIERMSDEFSAIAGKHASYTNGEAKIIEGAIKKANQ